MRPLEYVTPHKVKFQPEPVLESLEDLGWKNVVPRGATNSDEDSDPPSMIRFEQTNWQST
jgi:hypothetical protein